MLPSLAEIIKLCLMRKKRSLSENIPVNVTKITKAALIMFELLVFIIILKLLSGLLSHDSMEEEEEEEPLPEPEDLEEVDNFSITSSATFVFLSFYLLHKSFYLYGFQSW